MALAQDQGTGLMRQSDYGSREWRIKRFVHEAVKEKHQRKDHEAHGAAR
jgi:hypothetical protein